MVRYLRVFGEEGGAGGIADFCLESAVRLLAEEGARNNRAADGQAAIERREPGEVSEYHQVHHDGFAEIALRTRPTLHHV